MRRSLLLPVLMLCAATRDANAVGWKTQLNCASDYYAFCSKFAVGSNEVRKCMRDNGPKLSKACVSALIADGEISKGEVARHKETIVSAKARPKKDSKKVAKLDDVPEQPKLNVVRLPEIPPVPKDKPVLVSETGTLDQRTYEALKSRGPHFLADPVIDTRSIRDRRPHQEAGDAEGRGAAEHHLGANFRPTELLVTKAPDALGEGTSPGGEANSPETGSVADGQITADTTKVSSKTADGPKEQKPPVTDDTKTAEQPRERYSAGKMGLGKKKSSAQSVELEPSNPQAWGEYMQSRFNGGMNYEGLGAGFSKGK